MYEYSILFKSTATHGNADALSCLPLPETSKDPPVPAETVLLLEQLSESPISVKQIKLWTRRDPILFNSPHMDGQINHLRILLLSLIGPGNWNCLHKMESYYGEIE